MTRRRKPSHTSVARGPDVSDHALVRFLSRSGIDVEQVRAAMAASLSAAHEAAVAMGGADHFITVDGLSFVVRGGVVVTVLLPEDIHHHAASLKPRQS